MSTDEVVELCVCLCVCYHNSLCHYHVVWINISAEVFISFNEVLFTQGKVLGMWFSRPLKFVFLW